MSGNANWSQALPTGIPESSKAPLLSAGFAIRVKPMSGRAWATMWPLSPISCTKISTLVLVAVRALATDSVDGQRSRPSGVMRLDLLNEVGSSPAALARPEGDRPARAASRSRAVHSCACVSIDVLAAGGAGGLYSARNYSLSTAGHNRSKRPCGLLGRAWHFADACQPVPGDLPIDGP